MQSVKAQTLVSASSMVFQSIILFQGNLIEKTKASFCSQVSSVKAETLVILEWI